MEPTQKAPKVEPVNRSRRAKFIFALTGALMISALTFAYVEPDRPITRTIVESSYDIVMVIVVSYLASSSFDYSGALSKIPAIRRRQPGEETDDKSFG